MKTYNTPRVIQKGDIVQSTKFLTIDGVDAGSPPEDKETGPGSLGFML
jgi:hypothetical protein